MDEDLLAGRYQRVRPLGSGGMGDVWLAEDVELGRLVAVKRLRFGTPSGLDAELVERMLREARVVARLHHPAIVTLHDLVRVEGRPHLIMQYVDGESLAERIGRLGTVEWRVVARIVADVAGGLAAAHRAGVLHRDVKPANVLVDPEDRGHLADFGIARGAEDAAITRAGEMIGTVAFMPPEVARDNTATAASDVWSLGATFFAAVEGRAPFAGAGASVPAILTRLVNDPAPPPTKAGACTGLLTRMLASDPAARPTAAQVADEIDALLTRPAVPPTEQVLPPPPYRGATEAPTERWSSGPEQHERRGGRGWRVAAVLAAVVLLVAAVVGAVLLQDDGSDVPADARSDPTSGDGGSDSPLAESTPFEPVDVGAGPRRLELGVENPDSPLYVIGTESDDVTVIDPASGAATTIDVCDEPTSLAVARDGSRAYVGCETSQVTVVSPTERLTTIDLDGDLGPLRLSPDATTLYVPADNSTISVIDTTSYEVVAAPSFGTEPGLVHLTPDGTVGYAPDPATGSLARIDVANSFAVSELVLEGSPNGVQLNDDGSRLYVTLEDGLVQPVARDETGETTETAWALPSSTPGRLRLQPGTAVAWVPFPKGNQIWVLDADTGALRATIDLPGAPGTIVNFSPDGATAYMPDFDAGTVQAIDTGDFSITTVEGTGPDPRNITLSADGATMYVVGAPDDTSPGTVTAVPLG